MEVVVEVVVEVVAAAEMLLVMFIVMVPRVVMVLAVVPRAVVAVLVPTEGESSMDMLEAALQAWTAHRVAMLGAAMSLVAVPVEDESAMDTLGAALLASTPERHRTWVSTYGRASCSCISGALQRKFYFSTHYPQLMEQMAWCCSKKLASRRNAETFCRAF